jgi:glycosyltransferase involved in cell wall biosynthesis
MPAFNAGKTIQKAIRDIKAVYGKTSLIVINDGSTDNTKNIINKFDVILIDNEKNLGIGASLKKGIDLGLKKNMDLFLTIGADSQRDVKDIDLLLNEINNNGCDIVFGSKFLLKGQKIPFLRKYGNIIINVALNKLFRANFSDATSGFKIFNKKVASNLGNLADSYAFDIDLCIKVLKNRYNYREVPVKVFYHKNSSKMKNIFFVGSDILLTIIKRRIKKEK